MLFPCRISLLHSSKQDLNKVGQCERRWVPRDLTKFGSSVQATSFILLSNLMASLIAVLLGRKLRSGLCRQVP